MSFREWLYEVLVSEGTIGEEDLEMDEFTAQDLIESTYLEEDDLKNYRDQFVGTCERLGQTPELDVADMPN